ncbi:MAG: hypothetical protein OFPI_06550 [Osedax symbiont Rs2]|nr:MAG: hypothetical protein OFPI_06550 [Osedax symbiont Rs2]
MQLTADIDIESGGIIVADLKGASVYPLSIKRKVDHCQ